MTEAILSTHGLTKTFGAGSTLIRALQDVDISIAPREIVAIVGESGSGKSTFAELVLGIQSPSAGEIRHRNQPLPRQRPKALKRLVQFVPQNPLSALNPR